MILKVVEDIEDMADLAANHPEEFTMQRRNGFGASDSSILLGVNQWTKLNELIEQKNSKEITPEEIAIGQKPQVRMGNDLEPLVLKKFSDWSGCTTNKPSAQYRFVDYPQLTINYDGKAITPDGIIPVECKTVSIFAGKHWGWDKAISNINDHPSQDAGICVTIQDKILKQAEMIGIPPYYYTQVQQQLMGCDADHAILAALYVKDWNMYYFRIDEDEEVQQAIISKSILAAEQCPHIKEMCDEMF